MANRKRQSASEIARALDVDPFRYLANEFNKATDGTPDKRELALELLPYCYPKLKAIDATVHNTGEVTVTIGGQPIKTINGEASEVPQVGGDDEEQARLN